MRSLLLLLAASTSLLAQGAPPAGARGARGTAGEPPAAATGTGTGAAAAAPAARQDSAAVRAANTARRADEEAPAVTKHTLKGVADFRYTATTGMMPIRNDQSGETEGNIFYVAYTKDGANPATRPVTFVFNGGPGSSTVWLHMGAFGPKMVKLNADGTNPPPPASYVDNEHTLLDQTDLVFLDPVGTGYSRATSVANGPKFWGLDEDMRSVAEFIRMYLSRNLRWPSPKFIAGESYGTTRAAHLSGYLTDTGISLNGVMLISAVLNFENSRPHRGNDIAYVGFFPSFALTAYYHKKAAPELQRLPIGEFARQAEQFASGEYAAALMKGAALTAAEREAMVTKVARFTGMPEQVVSDGDLRLELGRFSTELLRTQRRMSGRLDSRFTAYMQDPLAGRTTFDPSDASIRETFTPVLNDYVRRELNYKNDNIYYILGGGIGRWRYEEGAYPNVVPSIERAWAKNPDMHVYFAMGYYDMATPYWAVQYTIDHMILDPAVRQSRIHVSHFEAGHMMYIEAASMKKMRADLRAFIDAAVPGR
ncbi:MAG: peptidase S10 [Gemmatimonadetes bacterium]|nr:peptidase S10 [Gemmatimonadota bacterium]